MAECSDDSGGSVTVERLSGGIRDVIVLTPHPDDAEYGCWAWIRSAIDRGHRVTILLMCDPGLERIGESSRAAEGIGATVKVFTHFTDGTLHSDPVVITALDEVVVAAMLPIVLAPHPDDTHQDHRAAAAIALSVSRRGTTDVAFYSTPTTGQTFRPNLFLPLSEADVLARRTALDCHETQRDKDYLTDERLLLKDSWWGIKAAADRAEPLQAERITGWML
jgi:LmbE family N-acetylglucosaminyl deacetylase